MNELRRCENTDSGFRAAIGRVFPVLFPNLPALSDLELVSLTDSVVRAAGQAQKGGLVFIGDVWARLLTGLELERERRGYGTYAALVGHVAVFRGATGSEVAN